MNTMNTILDALEQAAHEIAAAESWLRARLEAKGYEAARVSIERANEYRFPEGDQSLWSVWIEVKNAEPFRGYDGMRAYQLSGKCPDLRVAIEKTLVAIDGLAARNAYDAEFGVAA